MSNAADRLARSRLAIIAHVHQREQRHERAEAAEDESWYALGKTDQEAPERLSARKARRERRRSGQAGWFGRIKSVVSSWWYHHPAHTAVELAEPALAAFAEKRPFQYLGIATLAGAVLVVARPWRLMSFSGVLLALLKSSQLSGVLMSAMSGVDDASDHRQPP